MSERGSASGFFLFARLHIKDYAKDYKSPDSSFLSHVRYVSVHHPLDYNQAINDPTEIRKRLLKYFVPVAFLSVLMNVPKFFETRTELVQIENGTNMEQDEFWSSPGYTIKLNMTDMRTDPVYSSFMNSSQLIVLGIIPVCLLVYFNYKIYQVRKSNWARFQTV